MKIFCSIDKFFYKDLAGIRPEAPGFRRLAIKPRPVGDLTWVKAWTRTVRGMVAVQWERGDSAMDMRVVIPVNCKSTVSVPKIGLRNVSVKEGDETIWKDGGYISAVEGITGGRESDDYVTFEVGSGSYEFRAVGEEG